MKKIFYTAFAILAGAIHLSAVQSDEKVKIELNLEKDVFLHQDISFDMKLAMLNETIDEEINVDARVFLTARYQVKEVHDDYLDVSFALTRIRFDVDMQFDTVSNIRYDSNNPVNPELHGVFKQFLEMKLDLKWMKNGAIQECRGVDVFVNRFIDNLQGISNSERTEIKKQFKTYFNDELFTASGEQKGSAGFPDYPVGVNDTWEREVSRDDIGRKTTFTVVEVSHDKILLDVTGNLNGRAMVEDTDVKLSGNTAATASIDRKTGLVKKNTGTVNLDFVIDDGDEKIKMKCTASFRVLWKI